jgi:hypothetical protein
MIITLTPMTLTAIRRNISSVSLFVTFNCLQVAKRSSWLDASGHIAANVWT